MSGLRGWVWTAVAVAGTATAATLAYRYMTRDVREAGEAEAQRGEAEGEEAASELEEDEDELEEVEQQQQLALVSREGNMLLSVFGLVFLLLVVAVSMVVSWSSDQSVSLTELPMFTPLVWIAIGIFTAATVEVLNPSSASPSGIPEKVVDDLEK